MNSPPNKILNKNLKGPCTWAWKNLRSLIMTHWKKLPASEAISVIWPFMVWKIDVNAFLIVGAFLFLIGRTQILSQKPSQSNRNPIQP